MDIRHVIIQPCIVNVGAIAILTIEMSTHKASGAPGDLSSNGPSIIMGPIGLSIHYIGNSSIIMEAPLSTIS